MKIGIDARLLQESGIGRYLRNLILELQRSDKRNEYYIFLLKKDLGTLKLSANFHKMQADFRWYTIVEQMQFPRLLNSLNLDLVHFPHFNVPIFYQRKFVVTIHDLIHQHFLMKRASTHGKIFFTIKKIGYKKVFSHAVNKSQKIIVPSNYVKEDIILEYKNVDKSKVVVTYEGVEDQLIDILKKLSSENIKQTLEKYHIIQPFLFYLGNAHPHKNVEGLIEAYLELKKKYPNLNLVLSGQDHYFWTRIKNTYSKEGIIFTGFISDEEMAAIYKRACVRVIPSFEEGFGISILESFACGCPVVCSNTSSLPEIAQEAAVYFNPFDRDDLCNKIATCLDNQSLREKLIQKGKERLAGFSWKKMAKETLNVYLSINQR